VQVNTDHRIAVGGDIEAGLRPQHGLEAGDTSTAAIR